MRSWAYRIRSIIGLVCSVGVCCGLSATWAGDGDKHSADPNVKERIEEVLVERWQFFKDGDIDRDGYLNEAEFHSHKAYAEAKWGLDVRTFVFWMIDDDKDGKIALQEWFNNEIGQFQLGDKNHDGIIDAKEYALVESIQEKLFKDLGYAQ
jgi:hypothetical protein